MAKPWVCRKCYWVNDSVARRCADCGCRRKRKKKRLDATQSAQISWVSGGAAQRCDGCERPKHACECLDSFEMIEILNAGESWLNGVTVPDGFRRTL